MVAAFADSVETVAGSDHPDIGRGTLQVPPKVFEDRRVFRRKGGEIVYALIDARCQAGRGDIVTQDSSVNDLAEEGGLGDEFIDEVRNILLTFGRECFLVPRAPAECDHYGFAQFCGGGAGPREGSKIQQRAAQPDPGGRPQKVTTPPRDLLHDLTTGTCSGGACGRPPLSLSCKVKALPQGAKRLSPLRAVYCLPAVPFGLRTV